MQPVQITNDFPIAILPEIIEGKTYVKIMPMQSILQGAVVDQVDLEQFPNGVSAIFDTDGFTLSQSLDYVAEYKYHVGYPYKDMPVLLAWLKQQNMLMPQGI